MLLQGQRVQWGTTVLDLNNEEFRHAFADGRRYYFEDIHGEQPQRASRMTDEDLLRQIMGRDEQGQYHFDEEAAHLPITYLGIFLGYMSGPLYPETQQERQQRLQHAERNIVLAETVKV